MITDRINQKKSRKIVFMNTKSTKNVDKSTKNIGVICRKMRKSIVMHEVINIIHKIQIHRLTIKFVDLNCHTNIYNYQKILNSNVFVINV